jgi:bifunctional ADP-heptose synthase (sugar kinase/adenylyltransferase)
VLTNAAGRILTEVRKHLPEVGAWIISDHGYGAAAPGVASMIDTVKVGESRSRIDTLTGMTAVVVSLLEAERAVGHDVRNDGQARRAAKALLEKTGAGHLLLTRGNEGMTLFDEDGREGQIPPVTNLEAADAFGAGDAAAAAFTLALCCGATTEDAATLANLVGGFRVGRPANVQVAREEILAVLGE